MIGNKYYNAFQQNFDDNSYRIRGLFDGDFNLAVKRFLSVRQI